MTMIFVEIIRTHLSKLYPTNFEINFEIINEKIKYMDLIILNITVEVTLNMCFELHDRQCRKNI